MGAKPATAGQPKNVLISGEQAEWLRICDLLNDGQYQQVAKFLLNKRAATEQNNDPILEHILATAYQICLTCCQYRAEIELHQQACEDVVKRQREVQQQLAALLELASRHVEPKIPAKTMVESPTLTADLRPTPSRIEGLSGVWQRMQNWLGREPPTPEPVSPLTPERSKKLTLSAAQKAEETAVIPSASQQKANSPSLAIYCLGSFQVYQDDYLIDDWPSSKGKSIFKYLITHRHSPINKEVLMDIFWPDASLDAARNNLNVAIYGLRQALHNGNSDYSHVLFQNDCYMLNPELQIWLDVEEFTQRFQSAQELAQHNQPRQAIQELHAAKELYRGDFLMEDRYENWLIPQRQKLHDTYLGILDRLSSYYFDNQDYVACISLCHKMLAVEPCREDTHRRIMRCYCRQNQRYLGLRQYHQCMEALHNELEVTPSPETINLYEQIRHHEPV